MPGAPPIRAWSTEHLAMGDMGLARTPAAPCSLRSAGTLSPRIRSWQRPSTLTQASVRSISDRSTAACCNRAAFVAEARVLQQVLALHLSAEAAKLAVVDDAEKELAVAGRRTCRKARCWDGRCRGGLAMRPELEPVGGVRDEQAERGVEQRGLDPLAPSQSAGGRRQGQQDAGEALYPVT